MDAEETLAQCGDPQMLWVGQSDNRKTGNVPTAYVGATAEETLATCQKVRCPLLPLRYGGRGGQIHEGLKLHTCYAWTGPPRWAQAAMQKALIAGQSIRWSLTRVLSQVAPSARIARYTAIGDGGVAGVGVRDEVVAQVKAAGLELVGYTAGWWADFAAHWRGHLMASTFTPEMADAAVEAGWRAAVVLPKDYPLEGGNRFTTPGGNKGVVCPAQMKDRVKAGRKPITCNDCRLCAASRPGPVVGFLTHR